VNQVRRGRLTLTDHNGKTRCLGTAAARNVATSFAVTGHSMRGTSLVILGKSVGMRV
jgi:hypothetical protein